ncbi:5-deoxy-glucuronate isomerase [Actinomyces vulturis]|uniref:5-deoxy-glucuronate isomerase n=1 Tax=Actinomyces vulturis TaxID=1857645 RepID=UPI000AE0925B|nr:5-deoxy-glucuronate isomerase [Actinomyces vulturis]
MTPMTPQNTDNLYVPHGSSAHDEFAVDISPESAGWGFSSLQVVNAQAGERYTYSTGEREILVLPLSGSVDVYIDDKVWPIHGRPNVFQSATDYLYIPRETTFTIVSDNASRIALPGARATRDLPVRYFGIDDVRVDLRGAGDCSRQVVNYALNNGVETSHLLCCEVLTPGGNWSSYPAHKHDEHSEHERELEEIYYFEIASSPEGAPGFGFHGTYGTPDRPINLCIPIRDGDVALVPHGYHGPCVAAPGYTMYYLNVMAGPSEDGQWLAPDDPDHHWIRSTWADQEVDPRLPMY